MLYDWSDKNVRGKYRGAHTFKLLMGSCTLICSVTQVSSEALCQVLVLQVAGW